MSNRNTAKFIFFVAILAIIAVFSFAHPSVFVSRGDDDATTSTTGNKPPLLVLPSLSADISAQAPVVASGSGSGGVAGAADNTAAEGGPVPDVAAAAYLIANLQTGQTIVASYPDERWPLASVSKLMTAAVATDLLSPDQRITITDSMMGVDPSQRILHVGDTYTVSDLLRIMLLPSDNVAAEAFAEFYGRDRFLAAMNAKAAVWGMGDTYYDDPSGLSAANESTADDLLKLAQHIDAQYPQILAITRTPEVTVMNLAINQPVDIKSINEFAGQPDFIGGKTGYTDQADGNLLSLFSDNGTPVFIVVLGVDEGVRFDVTQTLYAWLKNNATL